MVVQLSWLSVNGAKLRTVDALVCYVYMYKERVSSFVTAMPFPLTAGSPVSVREACEIEKP